MLAWERALVHEVVVGERFVWRIRKVVLLGASLGIGIAFAASPGTHGLFLGLGELALLGVFIAGILFAYGFTTVPALAALFVLAHQVAPLPFALAAAAGAALSDALLFHIARRSMEEEAGFVRRLFRHPRLGKGGHEVVRALSPVMAGLLLASPVPDDVLSALFGSFHYDARKFVVLSFAAKFFMLLAVASAAQLV